MHNIGAAKNFKVLRCNRLFYFKPVIYLIYIDFPYFVARVSRFYSMSYREVLDMPLRAFWSFNRNVRRLRAEESLAQMELFMLANCDANAVKSLRQTYAEQMEEPMKEAPRIHIQPQQHKEGIAKLRTLRAQMKQAG